MKDKIALVTGGSRGVGRATVIEFAKRGVHVVINYHKSKKAAEELRAEVVSKYGVKAIIIQADIKDEAAVQNLVQTAINEFGQIDFLVNNVGIAIDKEFNERTLKEWQETFSTNLFGIFLVSKHVGQQMMDNKFGKIVNLSSTSGIYDFSPYAIDYNASKAGVVSLTKSLAIEFSPFVNVNAVAPGWVDTEMNDDLPEDYLAEEMEKIALKRIARPEEIAQAIVFLCSEEASYVNGTVLEVHGGRL